MATSLTSPLTTPLTTGKLKICPGRSWCHCIFLLFVYFVPVLALLWLDLDPWMTFFVMFCLVVSLWHEVSTHGLRSHGQAVKGLECDQGVWVLTFQNRDVQRFSNSTSVVVLDWLVILNFRDKSAGKIYLPIFIDSLPARDFRHLRAYLNLKLDLIS